jgi:hypothetical protein
MEEYAGQPRGRRLQRLTRTADELAAAIKGQSDGVLSRRPDAKNWAAKEIVCHLRDTEEALAAFRRRRAETLDLFAKLEPGQWEKGGIHPVRGRFTIDAILSIMAWHDDNHLGQLMRALEGASSRSSASRLRSRVATRFVAT